MNDDDKRNEHLKLMANAFNTLAAAVATTGTLVPAAQFIFAILPKTVDPSLVGAIGISCVGAGIFLNSIGQAVLRGLR